MKKSNPASTKNAVTPLADRVLIQDIPDLPPPPAEEDRVIGGIFVPGSSESARLLTASEDDHKGDGYVISRVLAVGDNCKSVKAGQDVLLARHHAFYSRVGDVRSTFVKETDVIAIVE